MIPTDEYVDYANKMRRFVKQNKKKRFYILPHSYADPDAVSSSIIVHNILLKMGVKESFVLYSGLSSTSKILLSKYPYPLKSIDEVDFHRGDVVVVVDTNSLTKLPEMIREKIEKRYFRLAVIDHHLPLEQLKSFADLYLYFKTTSTTKGVVYIYLYLFNTFPKSLCPFAIAGILADTGFLRYSDKDDLSLVNSMVNLLNTSLKEFSFLYKSWDALDRSLIISGLKRAKYDTINGKEIVFTHVGSEESSLSNLFVQLGFNISIVVNSKHKRISIRMDSTTKHITECLLSNLNSKGFECGGHEGVIGCNITTNNYEKILSDIKNSLKECLR